jgi:hypothetical protein
MFTKRNNRVPEYTGKMIVCLDKARPYQEVPDGRAIIGYLTHVKIKTSNVRNQRNSNPSIYSERDIAVPVYIVNKDVTVLDREEDWTNTSSPITEIKCAAFPRWWPKSIFKGSQKIGDIAEEITLEYQNYVVKLDVTYAFATDLKMILFNDIQGINNKEDMVAEPDSEYPDETKNKEEEEANTQDSYSIHCDDSENSAEYEIVYPEKEKHQALPNPSISKKKVIFGIGIGIITLAAFILLGSKIFGMSKNK